MEQNLLSPRQTNILAGVENTENRGKLLALDVGTRRTGLAISDEDWHFAFPLASIEAADKASQFKKIAQVVEEEEVSHILLGIPLNQMGEVSAMGKTIQRFGQTLRHRLRVPVIEWDESYTSARAEEVLIKADVSRKKRKKVVDKLAASLLLQSYLDSLETGQTNQWQTPEK